MARTLVLAESVAWGGSGSHTQQTCCLGVTVRNIFISSARANNLDVAQLSQSLNALGLQSWVDCSLGGGDSWWRDILRRIADCDVFIAIISRDAVNSVACEREFEWTG